MPRRPGRLKNPVSRQQKAVQQKNRKICKPRPPTFAPQGATQLKPQTRATYAHRLDPVLRWLASHPDADPDLYQLADLACLSPITAR
ncbi:hypothetical protein CNMCM8686_007583 [Aspergillus fumigatus]|nr:hypothetical protein CNMCM8686_007583 [Aspergillus fumigatus]